MAPRLCDCLKKCVSLLFKDAPNIDSELSSSDWTSALNALQNSSMAVREKPATSYCTYSGRRGECCKKQASFSQMSQHIAACRNLLDLLCRMMETSLSCKSFSRCAMCLVNFERFWWLHFPPLHCFLPCLLLALFLCTCMCSFMDLRLYMCMLLCVSVQRAFPVDNNIKAFGDKL